MTTVICILVIFVCIHIFFYAKEEFKEGNYRWFGIEMFTSIAGAMCAILILTLNK